MATAAVHRNSHPSKMAIGSTDGIPDCRCGCGMVSEFRVESVDDRGEAFTEYCCGSVTGYLAECAHEEGQPFTKTRVRAYGGYRPRTARATGEGT